MENKPTLTIGIPAFNEEANIGYLLEDLIKQKSDTYTLESITVASDASSDKTDSIVKAFEQDNVKLISNTERQGQAAKQNQIIEGCDSDILVLLNADILIEGTSFIDNLIKPILFGADLSSGPLKELLPTNYFEKILYTGSQYRRNVFESYKNGNNIFTCHGSHRALSRRFYKNFRFAGSVAEDSFSYLSCIKMGYKYAYAKDSSACIKLPSNLKDHISQSSRFFSVPNKLTSYFDKRLVHKAMRWPVFTFIYEGIKLFFSYPIESILYVAVSMLVMTFNAVNGQAKADVWKTVQSSKFLRG